MTLIGLLMTPFHFQKWVGVTYFAGGKKVEKNIRIDVIQYHTFAKVEFMDGIPFMGGQELIIGEPFAEEV